MNGAVANVDVRVVIGSFCQLANLKNQGVMCKIMHAQLDKDLIKLSSYNPAYPSTEYRRDEFHWVYPVATIIKQLRRG